MLNLSKMILAMGISFLCQQFVWADPIIELDNKNYSHCVQQLESVKDEIPVILVYAHHCIYAQIFLPTYQEVANSESQKNRAFFQFDWDDADSETAHKCLGLSEDTMLASPVITVRLQIADETGKLIRSLPIRSWGGVKMDPESGDPMSISPKEVEHIITFGDELRLYKAQLLAKKK